MAADALLLTSPGRNDNAFPGSGNGLWSNGHQFMTTKMHTSRHRDTSAANGMFLYGRRRREVGRIMVWWRVSSVRPLTYGSVPE